MGKFTDWANENSEYLTVLPGAKAEVEWTGDAQKAKNNFGKAGWEFTFKTAYGVKTYWLGNMAQVAKFDEYLPGEKLVVIRTLKDENGKTRVFIGRPGEEAPF